MKLKLAIIATVAGVVFTACSNDTKTGSEDNNGGATTEEEVTYPDLEVPSFNQDSAYNFVARQVDFGPRVPNTTAHLECGDYLVAKLKEYGAMVIEQKAEATTWDNVKLNMRNIIGQYKPEEKKRIMLCAHWDSRPWADRDNEEKDMPILGANDGASGVGILLEIARQMSQSLPHLGVDIIFFDAEDWGNSEKGGSDSYCLGSQYWSRNPHKPNYLARYGILLDMVGGEDAIFAVEQYSQMYAPSVVNKVWSAASNAGYRKYFHRMQGGHILDDHYYINTVIGIPTIDIIQHDPDTRSGFGSYWHTHDDNMDVISKPTLQAVGQTLLEVIYNEKP